ncbi:hypothetical protein RIF29_28484 [Crotalaria pallida]|uniref:1-deoxy-D-xylulose 5-phosphate reductoisomerase N-terminal domain-containing protein n=1 Tax=Crotalaria pallida TaxID=3830 RepID=A0AAN9HV32_CROPI
MKPVTWPSFTDIHPFAPTKQAQGDLLCDIIGFDSFSLQPNIGAAGKYVGLMVICAYHLPTVAAIEAGKDIALSNKETMIVGAPFDLPLAQKHNIKILPVDSEHPAIFHVFKYIIYTHSSPLPFIPSLTDVVGYIFFVCQYIALALAHISEKLQIPLSGEILQSQLPSTPKETLTSLYLMKMVTPKFGATFLRLWVGQSNPDSSTILLAILYRHNLILNDKDFLGQINSRTPIKTIFLIKGSEIRPYIEDPAR